MNTGTKSARALGWVTLILACSVGLLSGQDPLQLLPNNYRLLWQNDFVRVIHVSYGPGEKLPPHNHTDSPTLFVYLTDSGPVRFSHVEEHPFVLVRPPAKAGTFRFSPGRLEKHAVENLGDIETQFLRVELRQLPLGYQGRPFRSQRSFDATHSGSRTEFETPLVKVQRIIAAPREVTTVDASDAPALLIAFSRTSVQRAERGGNAQNLSCGDVLWIDAHHALRIKSGDQANAGHLLRVIFEPKH